MRWDGLVEDAPPPNGTFGRSLLVGMGILARGPNLGHQPAVSIPNPAAGEHIVQTRFLALFLLFPMASPTVGKTAKFAKHNGSREQGCIN
jgi:hypothetical protein